MKNLYLLLIFLPMLNFGQTYTNYFLGNPNDISTFGQGGVCLMGGATENDDAMRWFLERANGGDVLVLRASGGDGYNSYFYSDLGVAVNSVETIVFYQAAAANEAYIHQRIAQAEAIWFAGGDQADYVSYWRGTAIDSLLNVAINQRQVVVGGTSAGMAILGSHYFSAQFGSATSALALADPTAPLATVDSADFLKIPFLENTITDTHYDNPDRRGRHLTFLARMFNDYSVVGRGIACDEYTAVCVDSSGVASIFGDYPNYDDNAYFLQINCEIADPSPENFSAGQPLTWDLGGAAVKVYAIKGTPTGNHFFDLNDWTTGNGGVWQNWSADNGTLETAAGNAPNCTVATTATIENPSQLYIFPNPVKDGFLNLKTTDAIVKRVSILDAFGRNCGVMTQGFERIEVGNLPKGVYFLVVETEMQRETLRFVVD